MWRYGRFPLLLLLLSVLLLFLHQPSQTQADESATPTRESWIILPEMPETATQADYGAEIYRLVCRDCHGDVGQGLTEQWRMKGFAPDDQNCWQAKCHASTHPIDGFKMPQYVPPLAGAEALSRFNTSLDMFNYMRVAMPYHNPGSLLEREYWQLTAFIVQMNGLALPVPPLDETTAAQLRLHPDRPLPTPAASPTPALVKQPTPTVTDTWSWGFLGLLTAVGVGTAVLLWRRQ